MKMYMVAGVLILAVIIIACANLILQKASTFTSDKQARLVGPEIRDFLRQRFGEEYESICGFKEFVPKGLFKDGKLFPMPGAEQRLQFFCKLDIQQISILSEEIIGHLGPKRDSSFVPIKIDFFSIAPGGKLEAHAGAIADRTVIFGDPGR
jgi:hypothetical protein